MQKKNPKTRCEKRSLTKANNVCRFYNRLQSSYADQLEANPEIEEIICNYLLKGLDLEGEYTSDFVCRKTDGTLRVRECVYRKYLTWPSVTKLLDASLVYWRRHGVDDWGLVIDKEERNETT